MKSSIGWKEYQKLELLDQSTSQPSGRTSLKARFTNFWQTLLTNLKVSSEPHVWQTQDAIGQTIWHGYDPITKQSIQSLDETDLRVWLEERHYQYQVFAQDMAQQVKVNQLAHLI